MLGFGGTLCHYSPTHAMPGWDQEGWAGGLADVGGLDADGVFHRGRLLQDLFPKAAELYERVASNREQWTKVSHKFTIRGLPSNNSLDFLDEEYDPQAPDPQLNGCLELEGAQSEAE